MKYIAWAVVIIVCFVLGKVMYAPLGPALLSKDEASKAGNDTPTVIFGSTSRGLSITLDLRTVSESELPARVKLKKKALVGADDGSNKTPLAAGDEVRVIERSGANLVIAAAGGPLQGLVPIEQTDFAERVIETRVAKLFPAGRELAGNATPPPVPQPTEPTPGPEPTRVPEPPVVTNIPTPQEAPEPAPEPQPEPVAAGALNAEEIVAAMKASITAGEIKEFAAEQVQEWNAGEEEEVDGERFQTGLATYKAQTIFGEKIFQAKALIKDRKVTKWIYAKTGMEIR